MYITKAATLLKLQIQPCRSCVCLEHSWTSSEIRKTFVDYFVKRGSLFVPSSSVVPKKNEGSYFVNAGMNQFKPIFLGTVDMKSTMAGYQKVVNYQKCIRIGGKHNDLEDVGRDLYHHTFFEMLGNWSFNNYSKSESCRMAWELLTKVFEIPEDKLYVTYFKGDKDHNLKADIECRDIWLSLGVPKTRVLPFGLSANFWAMGETGPCGPCTEIHYCHKEGIDCASLVNAGSQDVVEIWNLVFMQYDRTIDGKLKYLPHGHLDTGMGLERLTAVLQKTHSNYSTDLFRGIFSHISDVCKFRPYSDAVGDVLDTAYRIVADHARMFTVCISDRLMPGRKESEGKLRNVIYRSLYQANEILKAPPGFIDSLVPCVVESLGEAYPRLQEDQNLIREVLKETEHRYLESLSVGRQMMKKAVKQFGGDTKVLSGEQIMMLQEGKFGKAVSFDIVSLLANEFDISLDERDYENVTRKETAAATATSEMDELLKMRLDRHDISYLESQKIERTVDAFKNEFYYSLDKQDYEFPPTEASVKALKVGNKFLNEVQKGTEHCGVVVDVTSFYSEAGGQAGDVGRLSVVVADGDEKAGNSLEVGNVVDVTKFSGFVLHILDETKRNLKVGDKVLLTVDEDHKLGCMANHTATHILNHALNKVLKGVRQHGSSIKDSSFTFDFTCLKANVTLDDLKKVIKIASEIVHSGHKVHLFRTPLQNIENYPGLRKLEDEVYSREVQVVSIGCSSDEILKKSLASPALPLFPASPPLPTDAPEAPTTDDKLISLELCGGTHVMCTSHLHEIVVTNFEGSVQGTKRITAVTREAAKEALKNSVMIQNELNEIVEIKDAQETMKRLAKVAGMISSDILLPKLDRESFLEQMKKINFGISQKKHSILISNLSQVIRKELTRKCDTKNSDSAVVVAVPFEKSRDAVECILALDLRQPTFILSESKTPNHIGVVFVPEGFTHFKSEEWADQVCKKFGGQHSHPKGKLSKHTNVSVISIPLKGDRKEESTFILRIAEEIPNLNHAQFGFL